MQVERSRPVLRLADAADREAIYRARHDVYARELGQHAVNGREALTDDLDASNVYIVAKLGDELVGFVSVTPPSAGRYSVEKYIERARLPFAFDAGLFEVRLLTVLAPRRSGTTFLALMVAALRYAETHGATAVEALGRVEVVDAYRRAGLHTVGVQVQAGRATYEVMHAPVADLRAAIDGAPTFFARMEREFAWEMPMPLRPAAACFHGGAFFEAIGDAFETLELKDDVINADVLDAWFPPSPRAVAAVTAHLEWLLRTSPPTGCEGLIRTIAETRGVASENVLPGGGSSDLIYLALQRWLKRGDRALLLAPSYGEYAHLLGNVIGCDVERLDLRREDGWRVDPERLAKTLARGFDVVVIVNPNSPTGLHVPHAELERVLVAAPAATRFWVDETYVDYAGPGESLERFAAASANVVVCKSMSKAYALSGVRCAYLCAPPRLVEELRAFTPPWAVGLVGQVAAVEALRDAAYYAERWSETARLRDGLARGLAAELGADVIAGVANFLLFHLPTGSPSPSDVVRRCRERGLFLRAFADMPLLATTAIRIAVKDAATNARMLTILRDAMRG